MELTKQQVFDTVLTKLRKQGRQSRLCSAQREMCAYRSSNGDRCAIGHLIPDHLYAPEIEGLPVGRGFSLGRRFTHDHAHASSLMADIFRELGIPDREDWFKLLSNLQSAHDGDMLRGMDSWEEAMQAIARWHKLNYTPKPDVQD